MKIIDVLEILRTMHPSLRITGGEEAEGFWIRAEKQDADWAWERRRMHSAYAAYQLAVAALHG